MDESLKRELIKKTEIALSKKIIGREFPKQGADNFVFFAIDEEGLFYAVKVGSDSINDLNTINLIKKSDLPIKAPKVISSFEHEDKTVVILERVNAPLYGSIIKEHKNNFIKPLINQLNIIHQIKREKAGLVTDVIENKGNTWKELLLNKYSGKHSYYPWDEVKNREGVDADLLDKALEYLKSEIAKIDELSEYNLLHTDVNQNNIFLNIKNNEVESIIDWSESIFGDPIYDFARFRLNMWHNFNDEAFGIYFDVLNLSEKDLQKEKLYFLCHVIDYINWYSEFGNLDRVRMHQEYLGGICNK